MLFHVRLRSVIVLLTLIGRTTNNECVVGHKGESRCEQECCTITQQRENQSESGFTKERIATTSNTQVKWHLHGIADVLDTSIMDIIVPDIDSDQ